MNFLYLLLIGILIGIGAIMPGISSSVLCIIFGIYNKLVNSILGLFKDFKTNFKFIFPIALGTIIGIILFGNFLKYLLSSYYEPTKILFLGLILGSLPNLIKTINYKNNKIKFYYFLFSILSFSLSIFLIILEQNNSNYYSFSLLNNNYLYKILCGFLMSAGIIIPGVSSTVILMLLGIYNNYLDAISTINLSFLLPLSLGLIIGSFLFLILIKKLMNKFYLQTFFTILGFVIGSCFILIPNNFYFYYIPIFILGFLLAFMIKKEA